MHPPDSTGPRAGGFLLAASILIGAVAGILLGQPSMGFLAGTGIGVAIAVLLWLWDRRHRQG
jgi:hypothetical protein